MLRIYTILILAVVLGMPITSVADSGGTWKGVARYICLADGKFTVREYPTTVVLDPTGSNTGKVTASPSFAMIEGSSDACTTAPSGTRTSQYFINGSHIFVTGDGENETSFGTYDFSIVNGTMTVSGGPQYWILRKSGY